MPKEKTTSRKTKASKADGKKKKGTRPRTCVLARTAANNTQTPTRPSVVFPPTCSSPMTCATRSARRTPASSLVRSARSSVRGGRLCPRSSALPTRPRLPMTRSVTRTRRLPTMRVVTTRMRHRSRALAPQSSDLPSTTL